jgi:predicted ATP-dependent serine protease
MTFWTWPALRVEIEYRQEQVRRDAAGPRWRRARRSAVEASRVDESRTTSDRCGATPAPRESGPGERRVPVGSALVSGDAGVGKTRLLEELGAQARSGGALVLVGRCLEAGESGLPYLRPRSRCSSRPPSLRGRPERCTPGCAR